MIPNQIDSIGPIFFAGVFGVIALLALLILPLPILIVANRAEPDARGMRPFAVYLFGMAFVTLLVTYSGLTMIVTALFSFISPHYAPIGNSVAREVVIGALLVVIAGSTMRYHWRQGMSAARGDGRLDGPNARILHSYIGVVSFIFVLSALVALGVGIYLIFELAGPGIFGGGPSKTATLNTLLDFAYVLVTSASIVRYCWRQAPPGALRAAPGAAA